MLSDTQILDEIAAGSVGISPFNRENLRPSSYTLTLSSKILVPAYASGPVDLRDQSTYPSFSQESLGDEGFVLEPGAFVLAGSNEKISLSRSISATLRNLTGLSRLGISTEIASLVSPGFGERSAKNITLELKNFSPFAVRIFSGMRACHMIFFKMSKEAQLGYDVDVGVHDSIDAPAVSKFWEYFQ
ncbi:dCTP deaminase [Gemmobacter denitrificans]|uniref:dCTP deaminase n=1 Tax=Gemmobacter denitrificans TaxID=3123040 RepID=A0ABU8BYQ3_9RHOB